MISRSPTLPLLSPFRNPFPMAPTARDNVVAFPGPDGISWFETAHASSEGQPYEGVSTERWYMHIKAGRRQGPGPAAVFCRGLDEENMLGLATLSARPQRLNFVSVGSLTVSFAASGIVRTC